MKQLARLLLVLALLGAARLAAEGPDDQFVRIYGLIQDGDSLKAVQRNSDAAAKYREALDLLLALEKDNPNWNPTIVGYRKQYLQERVGELPRPTEAARTPATPAAVPQDPKLAALTEELNQLRAERDLLQAKLREALAPQPAGIDPKELEKARTQVSTLQADKQRLEQRIAAQERKLAEAVEPGRLEEAQKALAEARQSLDRQTRTVEDLTRQAQALQNELRQANEKAAGQGASSQELARQAQTLQEELRKAGEASAALRQREQELVKQNESLKDELRAAQDKSTALTQREKELLAQTQSLKDELRKAAERPAPAPVPDTSSANEAASAKASLAGAHVKIAELNERLRKLEGELATERERSQALAAEKALLERRVSELSARTAAASTPALTPPPPAVAAPAPTPPPAATPVAVEKPMSEKEAKRKAKYERELEKAKSRQLEREREELRRQVRVLTRQVEDYRRQQGAGKAAAGADPLSVLRARLEAYEARAVPYSPEELALLKQTADVSTSSEAGGGRKSLRQVPAGAATLLAEAQRAFQVRRYEEAEKKFTQALQLDERNVDMLTYLAAAQLEQARLPEAEGTLKRVLDIDANNPDGVSLMGLLRFRQARYDEAFDLLSRAAQLNPDNPYTQNYLGVTLSQRGQRKPAEAALRRAIALDPGYAEAHANLAAVYAMQQPPFLELARWHYQRALSFGQPKNADIEKLLGGEAAGAAAKPASQ